MRQDNDSYQQIIDYFTIKSKRGATSGKNIYMGQEKYDNFTALTHAIKWE